MLSNEPTLPEKSVLEKNLDAFFEKIKYRLRFHPRKSTPQGEVFYERSSTDLSALVREIAESFITSDLNTQGMTLNQMNDHIQAVEARVRNLRSKMEEETSEAFKKMFKQRFFADIQPGVRENDPMRIRYVIPESDLFLLKTNLELFKTAAFQEFQKRRGLFDVSERNLYNLTLEQLEFLKPLLESLVAKLQTDIALLEKEIPSA